MALPGDLDQVACNMTRAGDILRLVTLIVQPFRESTPPPQLDGEVLEGIIPTLCAKLGELATLFEDDSQELDLAKTSPCVFLLARILQFVLTTTVAWSPQARKSGGDLSGVIVRLMLVWCCITMLKTKTANRDCRHTVQALMSISLHFPSCMTPCFMFWMVSSYNSLTWLTLLKF